VDGTRVRLAEVEVGDETGTVSLRARDDQIDVLKEVSERSGAVVLRNCTLELYQGKHLRLAVTKWGKLSVYPDQIASTPPPPSKLNRDRNFSLIDLSLVASEMVVVPPDDSYQQNAEVENQAVSVVNRQQQQPQQYHSSSSVSRRGRRGHTHGMKGGQAVTPHYDPGMSVNPMNYQAQPGLHSYSGIESPQYSYAPRQQEKLPTPPQQQMMFHQQQYEMQQRQMQHMYAPQAHRLQTGSLVPSGVPQAASFETSYSGAPPEAPMSVPSSNPFLIPVQPGASTSPRRPSSSSSLESPGKMNPQAATFDPSQRRHYDK